MCTGNSNHSKFYVSPPIFYLTHLLIYKSLIFYYPSRTPQGRGGNIGHQIRYVEFWRGYILGGWFTVGLSRIIDGVCRMMSGLHFDLHLIHTAFTRGRGWHQSLATFETPSCRRRMGRQVGKAGREGRQAGTGGGLRPNGGQGLVAGWVKWLAG